MQTWKTLDRRRGETNRPAFMKEEVQMTTCVLNIVAILPKVPLRKGKIPFTFRWWLVLYEKKGAEDLGMPCVWSRNAQNCMKILRRMGEGSFWEACAGLRVRWLSQRPACLRRWLARFHSQRTGGGTKKENPDARWFNVEIFTEWILIGNEPRPTLVSILNGCHIKWMTWCLPTFTSVFCSCTLCTSIDFSNAVKPFSSKIEWPLYNL